MQLLQQPCTWPGRSFVAQLHLVALASEGRWWLWEGTWPMGAVGVCQVCLITVLLSSDRCMHKCAYTVNIIIRTQKGQNSWNDAEPPELGSKLLCVVPCFPVTLLLSLGDVLLSYCILLQSEDELWDHHWVCLCVTSWDRSSVMI